MDEQEMKDRGLTPEMVAQPADLEEAPGNFTDQNADEPVISDSPSGEALVDAASDSQEAA